jgi:hypothetical protein
MFEEFVELKYISLDKKRIVERLLYDSQLRKKMANKLLSIKNIPKETRTKLEKHKKNILENERVDINKSGTWHGMNIIGLCEKVDMQESYNIEYTYLSNPAHVNSIMDGVYICEDSSNKLVQVVENVENKIEALQMALTFFIESMNICFDCKFVNEVDRQILGQYYKKFEEVISL